LSHPRYILIIKWLWVKFTCMCSGMRSDFSKWIEGRRAIAARAIEFNFGNFYCKRAARHCKSRRFFMLRQGAN